jgi:ABC-2 type transport system permease protein
MTTAALGAMLRIRLRTGWKAVLVWVVGLGATMAATTSSISGLYDTQAKIQTYADAVTAGDALVAVNGRVAGVDTLGGVVANEFGFVASFAIPFMAIALVARMTRRDEEHGRLEMLLAGRIGRSAPLVAAVLVTASALTAVAAALFLSLVAIGVPAGGALLYSASMGMLGLVFTGVAGLAAQLVGHARGVYAVGFGGIVLAYVLRGVGDVQVHSLTWLSPLGWQESVRAFGERRWWPLLVPLVVAGVLIALAVVESARRDLGSARLRHGAAAPRASGLLRAPIGLAFRLHGGSIAGWAAATVVVSATFGALAQPLVDAIEGNNSLAKAMGASGSTGLDAVLTMTALFLGLLGGGYVVQAIGVLRAEETSGRLESRLAGTRSRVAWLGTHLLVVLVGALVVIGLGTVALVLATTWSTGKSSAGPITGAVASYLPAIAVLGGLAVLLFGALPRLQALGWAAYAVAAVIGYLGDALGLAGPVKALSPYQDVGNPPQDPSAPAALVALVVLGLLGVVAGVIGFRRRGIPQM